MKICPQCHTEYDDTKKFCRHDGSLLETKEAEERTTQASDLTCPQCGKSVEVGKKFCRYCGAKLETNTQPLIGEEVSAIPSVGQTQALPKGQCPSCGTPITPGKKFCRACGASLEPLFSTPSEVRHTPGDQDDAERGDQAILLRAAEKRRRRQETRRRAIRSAGLGAAVILLIAERTRFFIFTRVASSVFSWTNNQPTTSGRADNRGRTSFSLPARGAPNHNEEEILAAKRRLEALGLKSRFPMATARKHEQTTTEGCGTFKTGSLPMRSKLFRMPTRQTRLT